MYATSYSNSSAFTMLAPLDFWMDLWPFFKYEWTNIHHPFESEQATGSYQACNPRDFPHRAFSFASLSTQSPHCCEPRIPFPLLSDSLAKLLHRGWKASRKAPAGLRTPQPVTAGLFFFYPPLFSIILEVQTLPFSFGNFTVLIVILNSCSVCSNIFVTEPVWTTLRVFALFWVDFVHMSFLQEQPGGK